MRIEHHTKGMKMEIMWTIIVLGALIHGTQSNSTDTTSQIIPTLSPQQNTTTELNAQTNLTQPSTQTNLPQPSTQTNLPQPSTQTNLPQPSTQTNLPQPSTQTNLPEPSTQTNLPEPSTQTNLPQPSTQTNLPQPSTQTNLPQPSTQTNLPQPSTQTNLTQPSTQTNLPQPSTQTNLPQPSTQTNLPEPSTQTNLPQPSTQTNLPQPSTQTNLPQPSTQTNLPQPSTQTNLPRPSTQTNLNQPQTNSTVSSLQTSPSDITTPRYTASSVGPKPSNPAATNSTISPSQQTDPRQAEKIKEIKKDLNETCNTILQKKQGNCSVDKKDLQDHTNKTPTNTEQKEEKKDEVIPDTLIAILASCGALVLILCCFAAYCTYHRRSYRKNQQHLTEELQTVENGYHDNPTLEVMEVQPEMQEKKPALNGEFNDSWIVPIDNLLKEDMQDEEDTHL
nr:podocalyxin isoform X2 [Misgurnus anguillicaudatus]